jgi:hypothetical protein
VTARILSDEATVLIQAAFIIFVVFLAAYTRWHDWWHNTFGRALAGLAAGYIGVYLHQILVYWHILPARSTDIWAWLAVQARLIAPVCGAVLAWQVICPHLRWRKRHRPPPPSLLRKRSPYSSLTADAGKPLRLARRDDDPPDGEVRPQHPASLIRSPRSTRSPAGASPRRRWSA